MWSSGLGFWGVFGLQVKARSLGMGLQVQGLESRWCHVDAVKGLEFGAWGNLVYGFGVHSTINKCIRTDKGLTFGNHLDFYKLGPISTIHAGWRYYDLGLR